jgi:hypothetical protein
LLYLLTRKTSPKGFSAYKCDVGNWIFSKLGIFEKLFGNCLDFLGIFFGGFFWRFFFWRIFLEEVFWRIFWEDFFLGGFFREDFLGGFFLGGFFWEEFFFTLIKSAKLFESERD